MITVTSATCPNAPGADHTFAKPAFATAVATTRSFGFAIRKHMVRDLQSPPHTEAIRFFSKRYNE